MSRHLWNTYARLSSPLIANSMTNLKEKHAGVCAGATRMIGRCRAGSGRSSQCSRQGQAAGPAAGFGFGNEDSGAAWARLELAQHRRTLSGLKDHCNQSTRPAIRINSELAVSAIHFIAPENGKIKATWSVVPGSGTGDRFGPLSE